MDYYKRNKNTTPSVGFTGRIYKFLNNFQTNNDNFLIKNKEDAQRWLFLNEITAPAEITALDGCSFSSIFWIVSAREWEAEAKRHPHFSQCTERERLVMSPLLKAPLLLTAWRLSRTTSIIISSLCPIKKKKKKTPLDCATSKNWVVRPLFL